MNDTFSPAAAAADHILSDWCAQALSSTVKVGSKILAADGSLMLEVRGCPSVSVFLQEREDRLLVVMSGDRSAR